MVRLLGLELEMNCGPGRDGRSRHLIGEVLACPREARIIIRILQRQGDGAKLRVCLPGVGLGQLGIVQGGGHARGRAARPARGRIRTVEGHVKVRMPELLFQHGGDRGAGRA